MAAPWLERRWSKLETGRGVGRPPSGPPSGRGGGRGRGGRGGGRGGSGNGNGNGAANIQMTVVGAATSTGNQDITISGFGTPTGAIFIYNQDTDETNSAALNGLIGSIGVVDGTNERVIAFASEHAAASTSDAHRRAANDECVMHISPASGVIQGEASFVEWITDGVRINWSSVEGAAHRLTVILLKGNDISLHVGSAALAAEDASTTVTPGFQMSAGIFLGMGAGFDKALSTHAQIRTGLASYDGSTLRQVSSFYFELDGQGTTDIRNIVNSNGVFTGQSSTAYVEITNITSTSFDLTSRGFDPSSSGNHLGYIIIGGLDNAWAGVVDTPTSTGVNSWTAPNFTPTFALLNTTMLTAVDSQATDGSAGVTGLAAITADDQVHNSWNSEDGVGTPNTQSMVVDQAVDLDDDAGTQAMAATFDSFTASGLDLNFSVSDGTARKWPALFIA